MTALEEPQSYTFEEYLALEQTEQVRYQYYDGQVFAMAGGSKRHNRISNNLLLLLEEQTNEDGCEVFTENVKLEFQAQNYYVYPDVMLTCDADDLKDDQDSIVRNPILVVEVLSPSTADYDANKKKRRYFALPSLQYYLLVSQEKPIVEVYERQSDFWKYVLYESLEDIIFLEKLNMELKVQDIYKRINFTGNTDVSEGI